MGFERVFIMNRKKTIGLLVAAMGLSLVLTGCGETTVQVEGLPQEFHAYEDSGDVNSTVTIDNVDYTIEDDPYLKKQQDITVTVSGSYTYVNEDATATQAPEIAVQLVDKKGNATDTNHVGKVSITKKEVGEAYEDTYTFSVSKGGAYTVKLAEKK